MSDLGPVTVTVVTATYNYGEYIAETLGSVQAQTLTDWECIVVDDASTDDTTAVVQAIASLDPRIRYVRLERNGGVSAARNRALGMARGRYIQLLDADDLLPPGKLAVHAAYLNDHPNIAVVYSDFIHFSHRIGDHGSLGYLDDERITGPGTTVMARLVKGNIFRPATVCFRASVLARSGLFTEMFTHVEDLDFWYRVAATGATFHFLDDPACLAAVRVHPGSLSHDRASMRRHYLPVLQNMWARGDLPVKARIELMLRYADVMLESLLVRREPVKWLPEASLAFRFLIALTIVLSLPLWLVTRPFRHQ